MFVDLLFKECDMEYEIGDDPQGLPEQPEGDRGGGLAEDRIFFRKPASDADARNDGTALRQFGETG